MPTSSNLFLNPGAADKQSVKLPLGPPTASVHCQRIKCNSFVKNGMLALTSVKRHFKYTPNLHDPKEAENFVPCLLCKDGVRLQTIGTHLINCLNKYADQHRGKHFIVEIKESDMKLSPTTLSTAPKSSTTLKSNTAGAKNAAPKTAPSASCTSQQSKQANSSEAARQKIQDEQQMIFEKLRLEEEDCRLAQLLAAEEKQRGEGRHNHEDPQARVLARLRGIPRPAIELSAEFLYELTKQSERDMIRSLTDPGILVEAFGHLNIEANPAIPNPAERTGELVGVYDNMRSSVELTKEISGMEPVSLDGLPCCSCPYGRAAYVEAGCKHIFCILCALGELVKTARCPIGNKPCGAIIPLNAHLFPYSLIMCGKSLGPDNHLEVPQEVSGPRHSPRGRLLLEGDDGRREIPHLRYVDASKSELKEILDKLSFESLKNPFTQALRLKNLLKKLGASVVESDSLPRLRNQMYNLLLESQFQHAVFEWLLNPKRQAKCTFCRAPPKWIVNGCGNFVCEGCIVERGGEPFCPAHPSDRCTLIELDE